MDPIAVVMRTSTCSGESRRITAASYMIKFTEDGDNVFTVLAVSIEPLELCCNLLELLVNAIQ